MEDFREEETEIISRTFLYIDIAVFAALIAAYAAYAIVSKRRAK